MSDINISSIQSQLKKILQKKYKYANQEFFKSLKFSKDFDWDKIAKAIKAKDSSIFDFSNSDTIEQIQEKGFMQIVNELFQDEDLLAIADIDYNKELSANELEKYFSELNSFDGNNEDISLDDVAQFIQNKNIDLNKIEKLVDENIAVQQAQPQAEIAPAESSDAVVDTENYGGEESASGNYGGGGSYNSGGSYNNTTTDTTTPEQTPPLSQTIKENSDNLLNIASLNANALSDENQINLQKVPEKERTALVNASQKKQGYEKDLTNTKTQLAQSENEQEREVAVYLGLVEAQTEFQEQKDEIDSQITLLQSDIDNYDTSIANLEGQIGSLVSAYNSIEVPEDTKENKSQRASALSQRAAIKSQIDALEAEKKGQENAREQVQTEQENLQTQADTLQGEIERITGEAEAKRAELDNIELVNGKMMSEYTQLADNYSNASSEYQTAKNEAIKAMQEVISKEKEQQVEEQKQLNENRAATFLDASVATDKTEDKFEQYELFHNVLNGDTSKIDEIKSKDENERTDKEKETLKIYNSYFGDEDNEGLDREQIKDLYGSEDNFFRLLASLKNDSLEISYISNGQEMTEQITYIDLFLNPESYTQKDIEEQIETNSKAEALVRELTGLKSELNEETDYNSDGYNDSSIIGLIKPYLDDIAYAQSLGFTDCFDAFMYECISDEDNDYQIDTLTFARNRFSDEGKTYEEQYPPMTDETSKHYNDLSGAYYSESEWKNPYAGMYEENAEAIDALFDD